MAKKQPHYSIPSWMTDVKEDAVKTNVILGAEKATN